MQIIDRALSINHNLLQQDNPDRESYMLSLKWLAVGALSGVVGLALRETVSTKIGDDVIVAASPVAELAVVGIGIQWQKFRGHGA
jgi:hypothetical protein